MVKKLIGLNFGFCIKDLYEGEVHIEEVEKIITGTNCETEEDWERIILNHRGTWKDNPEAMGNIARQLIREGKIEQPKLKNYHHTPFFYSGWWVESEDQIRWKDDPNLKADIDSGKIKLLPQYR